MSAAHKRMWVVAARDWPPKQTALFFGGLMTSRLLPAVSRAASLFPHRGAANVSVPSGNLYVSGYAVPNGGWCGSRPTNRPSAMSLSIISSGP